MQDLLQPTVKRSLEDRELYDNLMKRCETLTRRVEDLETITHKSENKHTIFDDLFKKINDVVIFDFFFMVGLKVMKGYWKKK